MVLAFHLELHKGVFLRPNWNADPGSITVLYKRGNADVFMLSVSLNNVAKTFIRSTFEFPHLLQCEDMMGTIFISFSVRAREVKRYTELNIGEFIDEKVDSAGKPAYTLRNDKVHI